MENTDQEKQAYRGIDEIQWSIVEEFQLIGDSLSQYENLLDYSAELAVLDSSLKTNHNLVKGCQSKAWLVMKAENERLYIQADSDTLIVRGILYLLIDVVNGQRLNDVANAHLFFLEKANLMSTFTNSRRQGIKSVVETIQRYARESSAQS